jgi:hypothetical protein
MPRSRAPQVWQGPASKEGEEFELFATANTESSFSTLGPSHFLQSTLVKAELTILSN